MQFTDRVSILIFVLILLAVFVFMIMSGFVIGPIKKLKTGERIILAVSIVGVVLVLGMAASELLFHVVY